MPAPVPRGPVCPGIEHDPPGAPFDEDAGTAFADGPEQAWCEADGRGRLIQQRIQLVLATRYPCDRGQAAILTVGRPLGARIDPLVRWDYVRDPAGEFLARDWIVAPYEGSVTLPPDAVATGWTNGNIDLWVVDRELDEAIYVVRGDSVERWPRSAETWGVTDCN